MNDELQKIEEKIKKDPKLKYHKLCGAGGGGYFLIITENNNIDLETIKINIDNKGVIVWDV